MLVMLLGGLWHGAAWTFVLWGAFHGLMLAIERAFGGEEATEGLPGPLRVALTFVLVLFSWVFFRAADLGSAMGYLASMLGLGEARPEAALLGGLIHQPYYLATFALAALVCFAAPQTARFLRHLTWPRAIACLLLFQLALVAMETQGHNPFIYFIF